MKSSSKRKLIGYVITLVIGIGMLFAVLFIQNTSEFSVFENLNSMQAAERYKYLHNAFTVPGVLLILFAALVWATSEGAFSGISYAAGRAIRALFPFGRYKDEFVTYYDYVQKRKEKGKARGYMPLLIIGGIFFCVGLIFLYLYHNS